VSATERLQYEDYRRCREATDAIRSMAMAGIAMTRSSVSPA
jgi:hypothetical protein